MTAAAGKQAGGFSGGDWATLLSGLGQGVSSALTRPGIQYVGGGKVMAKEAKRKTRSHALNSAIRNTHALEKMGQQHADEMRDFQANALQQVANGFVKSLYGTTGF